MMGEDSFSSFWGVRSADLSTVAIESDDGLRYSCQDLDRALAMMVNFLNSLDLPDGSPIAAQVEKTMEAELLSQATQWAGYVFLSLHTDLQRSEVEQRIGGAPPAVVVCSGGNFGWISKIAFKSGTQHVFTLNHDRTGSLLERAVHHSDQRPAVHMRKTMN